MLRLRLLISLALMAVLGTLTYGQLIRAKQIKGDGNANHVLKSQASPESVAVWGDVTGGVATSAYRADSLGFALGGVRIVVFSTGIAVKESLVAGVMTVVDTVGMVGWVRGLNINNAKNADSLKHVVGSDYARLSQAQTFTARNRFTGGEGGTYYFKKDLTVSFASGTANQVAYIQFKNIAYWGICQVSLTGSYSDALCSGYLKYTLDIARGQGATFYADSVVQIQAEGAVASQFKVGKGEYTSNVFQIPIYHLATTANALAVTVEGLVLSPATNTILDSLSMSAVTTAGAQTRDYNFVSSRLGIGRIATSLLDVYSPTNASLVTVATGGTAAAQSAGFQFNTDQTIAKMIAYNAAAGGGARMNMTVTGGYLLLGADTSRIEFWPNNTLRMTLTPAGKCSLAAGGVLYSPTIISAADSISSRLAAVHGVIGNFSAGAPVVWDSLKDFWARGDSVDSVRANTYLRAPYLASTGTPSTTDNGEIKINQSGMFWRGNGAGSQVMPVGGLASGTATVTTSAMAIGTACTLDNALISTNSVLSINLLSDPGALVGYPYFNYSGGRCIVIWPVKFLSTTNLNWVLLK